MSAYPATKKKTKRAGYSESDLLAEVSEGVDAENATLYHLRSTWYENIWFIRGVQYARFNMGLGRVVPDPGADNRRVRVVYNITRPIVEAMKAIYLAASPKRNVVPLGDDDEIIEAAEFASDLLEWRDEFHNVEEMCSNLVSHLVETGNAFLFVGWDPNGGRQLLDDDGAIAYEGDPFMQVVSPLEMAFHPHARSFYESPYCRRTTIESKEWGETFFPEHARKIERYCLDSGPQSIVYQRELANLTTTHGRFPSSSATTVKQERSHWIKQEYWHVPCPKWPQGLYVIAACRDEKPECILHAGPNPYTGLPFVHFKMYSGPDMAWGETIVPDLKAPQREINRRHGQLMEWANIVANCKFYIPTSIDIEQWESSNAPGHGVPVPDGAPPVYTVAPPPLHDSIITSMQLSMERINFISQPVGPLSDESQANVRSGTQFAMLEEVRSRKVAPMLRAYELAWNRVDRIYLDNWQRFQKIPRAIGVVRKDGTPSAPSFHNLMRLDQVQTKIVPYSSNAQSHVALIAKIVELTKVGLIDPIMDLDVKQEALDSLTRTNATDKRLNRSLAADFKKARENLSYIRRGQLQEVQPEFFDNASVHRAVYEEWMKSTEYREWRKVPENAQSDMFLRQLVMVFAQTELNNQLAMQAQAGKVSRVNDASQANDSSQTAQGPNGPQGVRAQAQQIAPGNPMGGNATTASQGFGRNPSPRERGPDTGE